MRACGSWNLVAFVIFSVCAVPGVHAAVGATAGSHGVSATGSASYTIQIRVPQDKLTPSLSITYDHKRGDGLLGVGFTLSGFSTIARCGGSIAQDGQTYGVEFLDEDRFCLDGNKLRVDVVHGGLFSAYYRTELETFTRVLSSPSLQYSGIGTWRAQSKDGLARVYGDTPDSSIETVGIGKPRLWAQSRTLDRAGNSIEYSYYEDTGTGAYRPKEILYGGNADLGVAPSTKVSFVYETVNRPDPIYEYRYGTDIANSGVIVEFKRLDRIDVIHVPTGEIVRSYDLTYEPGGGAGGRSRLASIQECSGSECFAPTSFEWRNGTPGWSTSEIATGTAAPVLNPFVVDFDNDGQQDILYPSHATSGSGKWFVLRGTTAGFSAPLDTGATNWHHASAQVIEFDGDGQPDLLVPCASGTTWCIYYVRVGTAPNQTLSPTPLDTGIAVTPAGTSSAADWLALDANGDGRSDLMRIARPTGSSEHSVMLRWREGMGFSTEFEVTRVGSGNQIQDFSQLLQARRAGPLKKIDVDADGREDVYLRLLLAGSQYTIVLRAYFRSGVSFVSAANLGNDSAFVYPGDFNGDGLTDFAFAGANWIIRYSRGSGYASTATVGPASSGLTRALIIDYDGDGRSDILMTRSSSPNWFYTRSTGSSFGPATNLGIDATGTAAAVVADTNGDALQDIVRVDAGNTWKLRTHSGVLPDLLQKATDGFGNYVRFSYESTAIHVTPDVPGAFYLASGAPVYPIRRYNGPMILVERAITNDPTGGEHTVNYAYSGGALDLSGRGFLGFKSRSAFDSRNRRYQIDDLRQDFPYTGMKTREQVSFNLTDLIDTQFTLSTRTYGTGFQTRKFPYVLGSTQVKRAGTTNFVRVVTTNSVDEWGVLWNQIIRTDELATGLNVGASRTYQLTIPIRINDEQHWCIGRPAQVLLIQSHTLAGGTEMRRNLNHDWDTFTCRPTLTLDGGGTWQVNVNHEYDDFGNERRTVVTPSLQPARTTSVDWGTTGRFPLSMTNADGKTTLFEWDAARGLLKKATDANGLATRWTYDAFGRPGGELKPDGTETRLTIGPCNTALCQQYAATYGLRAVLTQSLLDTADQEIATSRRTLDGRGRVVAQERQLLDDTFAVELRQFDALDRMVGQTKPFALATTPFWTTYTYDHQSRVKLIQRPTSDSDPALLTTSIAYDGLRTTSTDAIQRTTTLYRNGWGAVMQSIDQMGSDTDYEYDAFGNLLKMRDRDGAEVVMTYNERGMRNSLSDPDLGRWTFDYYPLGELKTQTDAKGQISTFSYDLLSRPLTKTMQDGANTITSAFTWGQSSTAWNIGQLERMQISGTGVTQYAEAYVYDSVGRLSQTTYTEGAATNYLVNYAYDAGHGLLSKITYPTSTGSFRLPIQYEYRHGRLRRVFDTANQFWIANTTDAAGRTTSETLGQASNGVTIETLSTYDQVTGLLRSRRSAFNSGALAGTVIANLGYAYDNMGRLIERQDNQQMLTEDFYYDALNRLDYSTLGAATTDYSYDARGNLTAKTGVGTLYSYTAVVAGCTYYAHPQIHAVRQITGGSATMNFCYDANGNMTNRNGTAITWFPNNLPRAVTQDANNSSQFQYGPTGQRWQHIYRTGGATYTHTYIGNLVEKVVGPTTTEWKHYIYANGAPVAMYIPQVAGTKHRYYLTRDHLGSVSTITRGDGAWRLSESFDAFGRRRGSNWTGTPPAADLAKMLATTRRGFTFHEHLDSTNLVHMNGRLYDPQIGRFLSADPYIQAPLFSQSLNRYSYAMNSPLNYVDPSGYRWDDDWDFDFDWTFDWDIFDEDKREVSVKCGDSTSESCAAFLRFAAMFLDCGFNRKCWAAWNEAHPLPGSDTPSDPPGGADPPPPSEPPPPEDTPPSEPPPSEPPQPTPTVPEPDAEEEQTSSGTEPQQGGVEKAPEMRPPGIRLPGLPGEDTYVTTGPITIDGVQWYVFSAQPDYGFDPAVFEYEGDPAQAFRGVPDTIRDRPNPEDPQNKLYRSVSVSSEGEILIGLPGDLKRVAPPPPDRPLPPPPRPKIDLEGPIDVPEPHIEFDQF
jgi:RHS repeat-associated protein